MAYDPKKKRPQQDSLDAVVDEIFGEEPTAPPSSKPAPKKAASTKKPAAKKTSAAPKSAKKPTSATTKKASTPKTKPEETDPVDNVFPLYPESQETPLIMQPQVWVATGIAALLVLFIARGRKKR